jgi:hypothetical protein
MGLRACRESTENRHGTVSVMIIVSIPKSILHQPVNIAFAPVGMIHVRTWHWRQRRALQDGVGYSVPICFTAPTPKHSKH